MSMPFEAAAEDDPLNTEEPHLTTEEDIDDGVVGQIFVKMLSDKTLALDDITKRTKIIDIRNIITGVGKA